MKLHALHEVTSHVHIVNSGGNEFIMIVIMNMSRSLPRIKKKKKFIEILCVSVLRSCRNALPTFHVAR